jgi:GTP-binding protein
MPKPLIAVVGRPNVGKSTLFNRLARRRIAITEDLPGTTRDRLYANCDIWGREATLIDTGGFDIAEKEGYAPQIVGQAQLAIDEADLILFVLDGREEPTSLDYEVADILRRTRKPVVVAANKIDTARIPVAHLNQLRLGDPLPFSALSGYGVGELTEVLWDLLPANVPEEDDGGVRVAFIGRPNVGKSSLTNRLLGYERSMVSDVPGTTRDAVDTKLSYKDQDVTLVDTAGMRRRSRVKKDETSVEYHMVLRALRAVDRADCAVLVLDAGGVTDQDTKIAGYAHEAGKAILICVNKWDLIPDAEGRRDKEGRTLAQIDYSDMLGKYLPFISYAPIHFTSAETGAGVEAMFDDALLIAANLKMRIGTGPLNDTIRRAVGEHPPASAKGRAVRIRYATQAEVSPPKIIIFSNRPEDVHFSYVRFLENRIRARFPFRGVPLKIELKRGSGLMTKEERLASKRAQGLEATRLSDEERAARRAQSAQDSAEFDDEFEGEEVVFTDEDFDDMDLEDLDADETVEGEDEDSDANALAFLNDEDEPAAEAGTAPLRITERPAERPVLGASTSPAAKPAPAGPRRGAGRNAGAPGKLRKGQKPRPGSKTNLKAQPKPKGPSKSKRPKRDKKP